MAAISAVYYLTCSCFYLYEFTCTYTQYCRSCGSYKSHQSPLMTGRDNWWSILTLTTRGIVYISIYNNILIYYLYMIFIIVKNYIKHIRIVTIDLLCIIMHVNQSLHNIVLALQKQRSLVIYFIQCVILTFQIVETMAYTNPVADFVSSLDSFYESVSIDDLEMVVGPIERGSLIGIFILCSFNM